MGGVNSGRRPTRHQGAVEHALALDMRALRRLGFARAGECVIDTLCWSNGGLGVAEARVRIDLSDIGSATLAITAQTRGGAIKQRVAIEGTPCRYGGHRFYFLCPDRGHRCEVLYLVGGRFASRKAHGLSYAVQGMDRLTRITRRRRKLRARLDGSGLSPRPRGRNRYALAERLHAAIREERELRAETLRLALDTDLGRARTARPRTR
jgi:hypothetical protein